MVGRCVLVSDELDANGEPIGWKKVLRTTDAIKMVRENIDKKILDGDLEGAEREKEFLKTLVELNRMQIQKERQRQRQNKINRR